MLYPIIFLSAIWTISQAPPGNVPAPPEEWQARPFHSRPVYCPKIRISQVLLPLERLLEKPVPLRDRKGKILTRVSPLFKRSIIYQGTGRKESR